MELIAIFKLLLSITLNFCTIWRAGANLFGVLTGLVGFACILHGMAGAGMVSSHNWHVAGIQALTLTIWIIGILPVIISIIYIISGVETWKVLVGMCSYIVVATMFWADWVISCITGDFAGSPNGKVAAVYWVYFTAKRFPIFAM